MRVQSDVELMEASGFIDENNILPKLKLLLQARLNICLSGPPGCAKTMLVRELAGGDDNLVTAIGGQLTSRDLLGRRVLHEGSSIWQPGFAQMAVTGSGKFLYIDEYDQVSPDAHTSIASLLDGRRQLFIPELATKIDAGPEFRLIVSYNPSNSGFDAIPRSTRDRFVFIDVCRLSERFERSLILKRYEISEEEADYLIRYARIIRTAMTFDDGVSTRQVEAAALAVSVGISPREAATDSILNPICASNPSLRTQLSNAILADGLDFIETVKAIPRPKRRRTKVTSDQEILH